MTTMVEKVAIAIFCAREGDTQEMWDRSRGPWKDEYRQQARAAIEALMEPTEAMLDAGDAADGYDVYVGVWTAMIQAALKEQE